MVAAATADALFVDPAQAIQVKVHPVVLLAVLDHYTRRPEGQGRVIGTLLGTVVGNVSCGLLWREDSCCHGM